MTTPDHYKKQGFTSEEFFDEVIAVINEHGDVQLTEKQSAMLWNIIKYGQRAGNKPGESWQKDAFKFANYVYNLMHGHFMEE